MSEPEAVLVPRMNPNDDSAVLIAWHVAAGKWVEASATIATLETTKTTFDVQAPVAGYLSYSAGERTMLDVGAAFAWIHAEAPSSADSRVREGPDDHARAAAPAQDAASPADARFSRKALRRMKELGLTSDDFPGADRVDVERVERKAQDRSRGSASSPAVETLDDPNIVLLEQSGTKMIEAATLASTYRSVVPSAVAVACDGARIEKRLRELAASGAVSLLELVIHEAARLLPQFPELNGFFSKGRAYRYRTVHIGFAVNLRGSLKVPVLHDTAALTQLEIAQRVRDLSLRYVRNELSAADLIGGTFTITDLTSHGAVHFLPVLNARQSAILAICAERKATRERELALAFDHQMSDGMQAAAFLSRLRARIEA